MCPPQARPTSNATSSATPNAATLGCPLFSTFWASSKTAPSIHPLDTEPAIWPDRVTTILEPSGRGLEPQVSTTVAKATPAPALVHWFSSDSTSRIRLLPEGRAGAEAGEKRAQLVQRVQIVRGQEIVAVGKSGRHASRERLIPVGPKHMPVPKQSLLCASQVDELGRELDRIAAIPAIAHDDDNRAVTE